MRELGTEYRIEQLLPIVAELADKYTSKESSSVTYERAERLMEAVIYCIKECMANGGCEVDPGQPPDERALYDRGRELLLEKVYRAKKFYEGIIRDFEDYGCRNYRDTMIKGMPEFFVRYDPVFAPGDHLLTLDYPLLAGNPKGCGIDLIFRYLGGVQVESWYLGRFQPGEVAGLLQAVQPDYQELYLDNICDPVLLNACGGIIAGKLGKRLELTWEDCDAIRRFLQGKCREEIDALITQAVTRAVADLPGCGRYFVQAAAGFGARIRNGMEHDCLEAVFHVI